MPKDFKDFFYVSADSLMSDRDSAWNPGNVLVNSGVWSLQVIIDNREYTV